jgi:hypothetical protein
MHHQRPLRRTPASAPSSSSISSDSASPGSASDSSGPGRLSQQQPTIPAPTTTTSGKVRRRDPVYGLVLNEGVIRRLKKLGHGGADPGDGRVRRVGLSKRGCEAIEDTLGPRRVATLRRGLLNALEAAGGMEAVRARRVPPVR